MARRKLVEVVRYLHQLTSPESASGLTDEELLERYVRHRDEAAFELLLWRHGVLVLNVCRRVLHREQDAEDAFQATFLTFVRKARGIVRRGAVASWLYKVAYRVALEAKARARKIAAREKPGGDSLAVQSSSDSLWDDVRPILDDELNRLPERLRRPFVLCYLEGKTNEEAARQLGCPPGTIYSRLARGRDMLRSRLVRRGVTLSTAALTALVSQHAAEAAPVAPLVRATAQAALSFAGAGASSCISPRATTLAEGVLRTMFLTKIKIAILMLFVVGVLAGGGVLTHALTAAPQAERAPQESLKPPKIARRPAADPVPVRVVKPTPGGLERTVKQSAHVSAYYQQQVVPSISGTVEQLGVDIGDRVKKGQVLAVLDAPLLVKEVEQATAAVELAKGQMLEAEANVATAEGDVEAAKALVAERAAEKNTAEATEVFRKKELDRFKNLGETVSAAILAEREQFWRAAVAAVKTADSAIATAKANVKIKQSKVAHARAVLRTAMTNLKMAEIVLDKARIQENFTRIVAAFDGVVTRRNCSIGEYIPASDPGGRQSLLTLERVDLVRVVAHLYEWEAPLAERGVPVDLVFAGPPGVRISGQKIARFSPTLDPKEHTMRIEIDVPNPKNQLLPGMYGSATIHFKKTSADSLVVPSDCVMGERDGEQWVYVVRDGKAHRTPVTVEYQNGEKAAIRGVKASDLVVIDPPESLSGDSVPVEVKKSP